MLSTTRGGVAFPMLDSFLRGGLWGVQHHSHYAFPYCSGICSNLFFFSSLPCLSWLIMVENYGRRGLLLMSPFTLHISFGRYMLMALTALLGSLLCPVILMSWAILSLPTLGRWVLSLFAFFFVFFVFFVTKPFFLWIAAHYPGAWGIDMAGWESQARGD